MHYLTGACTPEIDGSSKPHGEGVLGGPVEQVEVKVILQLRSVQDLEGGLRDLSRHSPRWEKQFVAGGGEIWGLLNEGYNFHPQVSWYSISVSQNSTNRKCIQMDRDSGSWHAACVCVFYNTRQLQDPRGWYVSAWYNVTVLVEPKLSVDTDHNLSTGYSTCKEYPSPKNNGKEGYNFRGERARGLVRGDWLYKLKATRPSWLYRWQ